MESQATQALRGQGQGETHSPAGGNRGEHGVVGGVLLLNLVVAYRANHGDLHRMMHASECGGRDIIMVHIDEIHLQANLAARNWCLAICLSHVFAFQLACPICDGAAA